MSDFSSQRYTSKNPRKGIVLIINNKRFDSEDLPERNGSDEDVANLQRLFRIMDFESEDVMVRNNVSVNSMRQELANISKLNHRDYNCFICFILSHGDDGFVYGTDRRLAVSDITRYFQDIQCPTLIGKPKLFFIQACRGTKFDDGVDYVDSAAVDQGEEEVDLVVPAYEPDLFIAYSAVKGYFSWRHSTNGSYFIQAVHQIFSRYWGELDLHRLMTRVHWVMANEFESSSSIEAMEGKKQMPCYVSTLTKDFYF
ncbi:Caspase-3 [Bulinus truncatus]|nr:Caspase-3 [Bulinus truncatus]